MAKRGGYGGMGMMPGNMNNLMKQAEVCRSNGYLWRESKPADW